MRTAKDLVPTGSDASRRRHYLDRAAQLGVMRAGDVLDLGCGTGHHVADMAALAFPAESFDLVTAFDSITQLPKEEHGRLLRRISRWLRPRGGFVANLGSGWDARTNRRLVEAAGLDLLLDVVETTVEDGGPVTFQWVIARKP